MTMLKRKSALSKKVLLAGGAVALCSVVALAVPSGINLYVNGRLTTTDVRVINGVAYAPITKIAKAMGQSVTRDRSGYHMSGAASVFRDNFPPKNQGGTYQLKGLNGKLDEKLSDGVWQMTFSNLRQVESYTDHYTARPYGDQRIWKADGTDKLLVLDVLAKNIYGKQMILNLARGDKFHTALASVDGSAYPLKGFDLRSGDGAPYGAGGASDGTNWILPGAQQKFTAIFSVPQDFEAKDLIFTIIYNMEIGGLYRSKDFRVALNANSPSTGLE